MKYILTIILALFIGGCNIKAPLGTDTNAGKKIEQPSDGPNTRYISEVNFTNVNIITIDSCEYIILTCDYSSQHGAFMLHKQNCKNHSLK